jgi:hypothetical protein
MPELVLQHVKGHQDRDIPYRRLSLLAQLNVDADAQASRYQRDFGHFQPEVLLTEWAGLHLEFPTGTVTAHYETALRYQATAPTLQAHIQERALLVDPSNHGIDKLESAWQSSATSHQ